MTKVWGTDELTLEEKAILVSGKNHHETQPLPDRDLPSMVLCDGPHGIRAQGPGGDALGLAPALPATCFPPAVAVGSSWDPEVARTMGGAIAREARAKGVDIVLGPGVNIKRSPLCGRNFEYYSEDPLVAGTLATAYVQGVQARGVGTSLKHFAANNQEADRMRVSAEVDERTLREIYFPAFERTIKQAQPATVMSAYNRVNGVFASEDPWLLTHVLRGEWGFEGAVVSDWGAVDDPVKAVRAGLDLEMPGTNGRTAPIVAAAVRDGELDEDALDACARRVLALQRWRADRPPADLDEAAHHDLARYLATQCAVLLRNEGATLPLSPLAPLAVIGEMARTPRFQGGGSSHVAPTLVVSFLDELENRGITSAFAAGYSLDRDESRSAAESLIAEAVRAAAAAGVAVVFAGLSEQDESEGFDRDALELPADQVRLIRAVAQAAERTVVVLSHGGVVTLEGWHDEVDAILDGFLLGQASGAALADLVFGDVSPSGRLAETIPLRLEDSPSFASFPGERGSVIYGERVLVGYRGYTTMERPTRYPFGHGLSYTTFSTSDPEVLILGPDSAKIVLTVTNTGAHAGAEVTQVYVGTLSDQGVLRPRRELRAYAKTFLQPGETRTLELALDRRAFAFWDVDHDDWNVVGGPYVVEVCADAETVIHSRTIDLLGDQRLLPLTYWSTLQEWCAHPTVGALMLERVDSPLLTAVTQPTILRMIGTLPMQKIVHQLTTTGVATQELFDELMMLTRKS